MYALLLMAVTVFCGGCSSKHVESGTIPQTYEEKMYSDAGHFTGGEGIVIGDAGRDKDANKTGGIGVNSFLWQASLETISFMPLRSTDPFGGMILTEWYTPAEKPGERMKVDIAILSKHLRPDSLRVRVFRQIRKGGDWVDATVSSDTAHTLENTILTQARKLKIATLAQ